MARSNETSRIKIKSTNRGLIERKGRLVGYNIELVGNLVLNDLKIEDCEFHFNASSEINLELRNSIITNCSFESDMLYLRHVVNDLAFYDCNECKNIKFSGGFSNITLINSNFFKFKDLSSCQNYKMSHVRFNVFQMLGHCHTLKLLNCKFYDISATDRDFTETLRTADNLNYEDKKRDSNLKHFEFLAPKYGNSIWNMPIRNSAICKDVLFDNVYINPFYFATKCTDKSTLDFSKAILIDDWSRLRKKYSGINLFIVFFLTLIFFLPYLAKSYVLLMLANVDVANIEITKVPLWEVLLYGGKEGYLRYGYLILSIVLILYNVVRLWMTISIGKLREEERYLKDSNFQMVSIHIDKLTTHVKVDKILTIGLWISVVYSIFKIIDALYVLVPTY